MCRRGGSSEEFGCQPARQLAPFDDAFSPRTLARFNSHDVAAVKLRGEFVWYQHPDTYDSLA